MEGECPHEPPSARSAEGKRCRDPRTARLLSPHSKLCASSSVGGVHAAIPEKSPRLCVSALKKRSPLNVLRAGTPALPTAHTKNTRSTRVHPVTNRLRRAGLLALLSVAALIGESKVLPETLMLVQTQFYPWREQARGYLGRYPDQPLLIDPDLPQDANQEGIDFFGGWSRYVSEADCHRTIKLVNSSELDGVCIFGRRDRRFFAAGASSPVKDFVAVPICSYPVDKGKVWETKLWPMFDNVVSNPCNYTFNGKILLAGYCTDKDISPADFVRARDAIRAKYGDRFLFTVALTRLLKWRYPFAANGHLTDAEKAEMAEYVRAWARVTDGVSLSSTSVCTISEKSERVANVPFFDMTWSMMRTVLDEPEFKGKKLLGLASIKGHMNAYMRGYNCLEDCTRTLRSYFELALKFDPDYIQIPEWDEFNESTFVMPSLYSAYTCRRIIRYYSAQFKRRTLTPIAGDDLTKPNLIISYRKCLSPGERLTIEVVSVPDGARQGPLEVAVELTDEHGQTLAQLDPKTLDEAKIGEARWELDSAALAVKARAPRVRLTWTKEGQSVTVGDGLHPIDLAPANTWNHLAVKQPIRDLAPLTRAEFKMDGRRATVAFASSEPIRYAMLCGNGCIQYVQGKDGAVENRFREDADHAVFQVSPITVGRHRLEPDDKKPYMYVVAGVPEAEWLYMRNVTTGETFTCNDINEHASPSIYLRLPKAKLKDARLAVEYAQLGFKGEIPLQVAYDRLAYSVGRSKKAMQVTVARFMRQARYPSVADANEVSFSVDADDDRATMMYHAQVVTMSGMVWYSHPVIREKEGSLAAMRCWNAMTERAETLTLPAARVPEMVWDFSPVAGNVMGVASGERHWFGLLGGPYSSATLWNRGARTEGAVDKPCALFLDTRDDSLPRRVQEADGSWALEFDGVDDFANVPCEVWPTFGGCTLEMEVMPALDRTGRGPLWANFFGLFDLGVEKNGALSASFWQFGSGPTPEARGAKLAPGKWTHIRLVNDAEKIVVWQDGVKTIEFPIQMPASNTMGAMIGGFPARDRGFFKGKIRNLSVTQRTE